MTRVVIPRLRLRVSAERAYCGRCGQHVGDVSAGGRVNLGRKRGYGWVYTVTYPHGWQVGSGLWEFELKRRRHANPAVGGPSTAVGAAADPGSLVVCPNPRCNVRQFVPSG